MHDGTALSKKEYQTKLQLVKKDAAFCSKCGHKTADIENYCSSCGNVLHTYEKATSDSLGKAASSFTMKESTQLPTFHWPKFELSFLKNALIPAIGAFVIMLLLNLAVSNSTESFYTDLMKDFPEEADFEMLIHELSEELDTNIKKPDPLYGFTDSVMQSHLIAPHFETSVKGVIDEDEGSFKVKFSLSFMLIIFIFIPIIATLIAGIIYGQRHKEASIPTRLYSALCIGLIYGLFLSIFSLFSGFSYDLNLVSEGDKINIEAATSYSFIKSFILAAILGTIFSFVGTLFAVNYRHFTRTLAETVPYGQVIHQSFSTFVRGLILSIAIGIAFIISKANELKENVLFMEFADLGPLTALIEKANTLSLMLGTQIGSTLWGMVHFTPLTLKVANDDENIDIAYSLFSGLELGSVPDYSDFLFDSIRLEGLGTSFTVKLLVMIPTLLFVWSGYKIAKSGQFSFVSIALYSAIYSLLVLALGSLSLLSVDFSMIQSASEYGDKASFYLGMGALGLFIRSFIFSYLVTFASGFITKLKG